MSCPPVERLPLVASGAEAHAVVVPLPYGSQHEDGVPASRPASTGRWLQLGAVLVAAVVLCLVYACVARGQGSATSAFSLFRKRSKKVESVLEGPGKDATVNPERRPKQGGGGSRRVRQTKMEQAWHRNQEEYKRAMDPDTLFESIPEPLRGLLAAQAKAVGRLGAIFQDPQEAKKALGIEGFSQY